MAKLKMNPKLVKALAEDRRRRLAKDRAKNRKKVGPLMSSTSADGERTLERLVPDPNLTRKSSRVRAATVRDTSDDGAPRLWVPMADD